MSPSSIPQVSLRTLVIGARQLVVQDAFETTFMSEVYPLNENKKTLQSLDAYQTWNERIKIDKLNDEIENEIKGQENFLLKPLSIA